MEQNPFDNYLFYEFHATGETSHTDGGPFCLGEIITKMSYIRDDMHTINRVSSLKVGEKFMWGMVCTLTRLPNNEDTYRKYLKRRMS